MESFSSACMFKDTATGACVKIFLGVEHEVGGGSEVNMDGTVLVPRGNIDFCRTLVETRC